VENIIDFNLEKSLLLLLLLFQNLLKINTNTKYNGEVNYHKLNQIAVVFLTPQDEQRGVLRFLLSLS
jgi:hypothetical protein